MTTVTAPATALERAAAGERLRPSEIVALHDAPADAVRQVAHEARLAATDPDTVTFCIGGNVDYTTICTIACKFCNYYRTPRQDGAYTMSHEEVLEQVREQVRLGITDVQVQGGVNPDLPYAWYVELLRLLKQEHPDLHVDFLSPEEVHGLERLTGRDAKDLLAELAEAGMDGLPGASAEILVDEVRDRVAPARISADDWFRIVDNALELGLLIPWTGLVFGLGETIEQRVEHVVRLRELQDADLARGGRGLGAYKIWPMRLRDTRLNGVIPIPDDERIIEEYLLQVAIHRLALDNVANHRTVWRTMGFPTAAKALRGGANDLCGSGSINAIDSVLKLAGQATPDVRDSALFSDVVDCARSAGFTPARRGPTWDIIEVYPQAS